VEPTADVVKAIERAPELEKWLGSHVCGKFRLVRTLREMGDIIVVY
jgi:hypothetical protein